MLNFVWIRVFQGFKTTVANIVVESVELEIYKQAGSTDV